jgi:transposase-like protein
MKVREDGRVTGVHCLLAVGVNGDGHREILGLDVVSSEDGAGWLAFFRGLSGVRLKPATTIGPGDDPTTCPEPPSTDGDQSRR